MGCCFGFETTDIKQPEKSNHVLKDVSKEESKENIKDLINATMENTPELKFNDYLGFSKVLSVYDGDTIHTAIENGPNSTVRIKCRLAGIDAPELRSKDLNEKAHAIKAKTFLESLVLNKIIWIQIKTQDKYGRYLVDLYEDRTINKTINSQMIDKGFATKYNGEKRTLYDVRKFKKK